MATKIYLGTKIVYAEPMDDVFTVETKISKTVFNPEGLCGYRIIYPDGYVSWSPKKVFESSYREVSESEKAFILNCV